MRQVHVYDPSQTRLVQGHMPNLARSDAPLARPDASDRCECAKAGRVSSRSDVLNFLSHDPGHESDALSFLGHGLGHESAFLGQY
ncbi:hypothetical protein TanjilG_32965 [Lupinus angustifolius]|uniref:Uncharacterized protein n=1 Tax=Lupinus angustifolius TaxID=3871 RepID=A0A4P1RNN7_LUPAN|nr:hypothetical protein TanjilG_32965 [Lupinus angustifolius]